MDDLTPKPLEDLLVILRGVGLRASMEATEVQLPGVWVALDELHVKNLHGTIELRCSLFLIGPDQDPQRALATLAPEYNKLMEAVTPDGPVVTQGVVVGDNPTPLPALRVPVYLYT